MRLLVADRFDVSVLEELHVLGVEIVHRPDLGKDGLAQALEGVGILVVGDMEVSAAAIEAATHLNLIVRAGVGVDNIDVDAASARGVYVADCPGKVAASVAELAFAFMLSLDRRLCDATTDLRRGEWRRAAYEDAEGLFGKRLGVAGLGAVGREVALRARAFGMTVHAWSRSLTAARAARLDVGFAPSLEQLAARSDILTLHLPLTPQTRGIVSRRVLEALPERAIFINTARAELVDGQALAEVCAKRGLRLGLDVFDGQPAGDKGTLSTALFEAGTVYGTPHIGASTAQSMRTVAEDAVRIIRSFLTEEDVPNVVNICASTPARWVLVVRMLDKVGVMANTLNVLKLHGINIEEISNTVFDGARAHCAKLRVSGRPNDACLAEIRAFEEVLHVDLVPMPNLA